MMEPVAAAVRKIICRYTEGHPTKRVLHKGEDVLLVNEVVRLSDAEARIKALEAKVEAYSDCLRNVCHHLEIPQSESGPCDDVRAYDAALSAADLYTCEADAALSENRKARFMAEARVEKIMSSLKNVVLIGDVGHYVNDAVFDELTARAALAEAAEALLKEAGKVLVPFALRCHATRNTHLLDWLPEGYDHCRLGSKDWAQSYLNSAKDYIKAFEDAARSLVSKIGERNGE